MANIFIFTPRAELAAAENVMGFIDMSKNVLTAFGKDLDWDSNSWDVSKFISQRGIDKKFRFVFSDFDTSGSRSGWAPMKEPFLSFAKAKMRYDFGLNQKENHNQKFAAYRALEKALRQTTNDDCPKVEDTSPLFLNLAAGFLEEKNPGSAYQSGCHLEILGKFLVENKMVKAGFQWRNPIKKKEDLQTKIGEQADKHRISKLPSKKCIRSIPQIYHSSNDPIDVVITSIAAIMFCSPDRFNEVFALSIYCEHEDIGIDGKEVYELRWDTSKNGDPTRKMIIQSLRPLCKEAIAKLKKQTDSAREIARWYEQNPGKLYLPKHLEPLRTKEFIRSDYLAEIIGLSCSSAACVWAKEFGLESKKVRPQNNIGSNANAYRFSDIEKTIIAMLPPDFPMLDKNIGLRYSEALFLAPKNFFHQKRGTYRCMFETVDIGTFNDQLGTKSGEKSSIFSRNSCSEDDGSLITSTSHDFRHYLSYIAEKKNVDKLTIALWASRKLVTDNVQYDARTTEERRQLLSHAGPDTDEMLARAGMDVTDPVVVEGFSTKDVLDLEFQAVHETRFGYCVREYAHPPCFRYKDCLACTDHLCITGNRLKTEAIRAEVKIAEAALARDLEYKALGISGVDVWVEHNGDRVKHLQALLHEMESATNPPGTIIRVLEGSQTSLELAVEARVALGDRDGTLIGPAITIPKTVGPAPQRALSFSCSSSQ